MFIINVGGGYYYYPFYNWGNQNWKCVLTIRRVTQLKNGRAKIQTQIFLTPESKYWAIVPHCISKMRFTQFLSTSSSLSRMRNRCVNRTKCKWKVSWWKYGKRGQSHQLVYWSFPQEPVANFYLLPLLTKFPLRRVPTQLLSICPIILLF